LENDWHGCQATKLFQDYYTLLTDQANAFFDSVFVGPSKIESAQPGKAVLDKEHTAQREKLVYRAVGGDTWEGR
jgi:DNA-binding transcriptional regulator PaaX